MKPISLHIDAFRGAVKPFTFPFQKDAKGKKRITILYGPNGSGKTTIVDALDVLANEGNSSLKDKSLGTVGAKPLIAVGRTKEDTLIRLESTTGQWTAKIDGLGFKVSPKTGLPRVRVLRRADLSGLLNEAGGDRYKRFQKFIDTEAIEKCEGKLKDAHNTAKKDHQLASTAYATIKLNLEDEWSLAGKPEGTFKGWLASVRGQSVAEHREWSQAWDSLLTATQRLATQANDLSRTTAERDQAMSRTAVAQQAHDHARAAITDETLRDLNQLLRETKSFLSQHATLSTCPVCEQTVSRADLTAQIESRLGLLADVEAAAAAWTKAKSQSDASEHTWKRGAEQMAQSLQSFATAFVPDLRGPFSQIDPTLWTQLDSSSGTDCSGLMQSLQPHLEGIQTRARTERDRLVGDIARHESIVRRIKEATEHRRTVESLDTILVRLAEAQRIVEQERKNYVDTILGSIGEQASAIYDAIHPDEELGKVKLILDPKKRASLGVAGSFLGNPAANPAAFYSEAHVDTLGFAIFLAEALRLAPEETILVLDDVVSSADEAHLERFVREMYAHSGRFAHVLITTHYRPWKDKFRMGLLRHSDAEIMELFDAPVTQGLQLGSLSRPEPELLRRYIAAPDRDIQIIVGKAGYLLEQSLYFITHLYGCPLACGKHQEGWTLGEYFYGISKDLKKALLAQRYDSTGQPEAEPIAIGTLISSLETQAKLRNIVGCHFNQLASHLPEADSMQFATEVLALAEALVDAEGELPSLKDPGKGWTTSSRRLRLTPLTKDG
jgi:energy-coupling factor transporter ATP-binding protein EcfA2